MSAIPYVVGQWVRGERFYGRATQLEEILEGNRNWLWLLGTRRVGKTSLLKQLEYLTANSPERGYFPLFWDLQGSEEPEEIHLDFNDSLLDVEERLDEVGIAVDTVEADDLFVSLSRLRRKLRSKKLKLLLLCDEVEELIGLNRKAPALLRKLRRALQSREDIRSVLASSIRLWDLAEQRGDTSPFLHGFTPPLYIEALNDAEAQALIRQSHLPAAARPPFDDADVATIRERCDNHPYLIQLVCKRFLESSDLEEACEQVATDRMVSFFFSVDFEMLSPAERDVIRLIARQSAATSKTLKQDLHVASGSLSGNLHRLEHLGYVRRNAERRFVLVSYFFRRWLEDLEAAAPSLSSAGEVQSDRTAPWNAGDSPWQGTSSPGVPASGERRDGERRDNERRGSARRATDVTLTQGITLGELDGRYELLQQIGSGATGVVYKAYDKLLQVKIAIKVLKAEYAANEEALERFRQEIILSRDIGQANILRIYHLGEFEGRKYITMKLVEGPTLATMIADEGPFTEETVVAIGCKLALALEAAHARQVLHRDIKPHNILVEDGREPYVTDFGLARLMGRPGITRGGLFLGTPYYTSPEQAALKPLDERSDLYALGLILYEMATGRRPFEADTAQEVLEMHRQTPPPDPRGQRPGLTPELAAAIVRCLAKDPAERYPDAASLRSALAASARS